MTVLFILIERNRVLDLIGVVLMATQFNSFSPFITYDKFRHRLKAAVFNTRTTPSL
jgi:hypothetical protein